MVHPAAGQAGTSVWGSYVDTALSASTDAAYVVTGQFADARMPSTAQAAWLASTYMLAAA